MIFQRLICHYGPDATTLKGMLVEKAVESCWFELNRRGGCGAAELKLKHHFRERKQIHVGDWIAFAPHAMERWYLGRVQTRDAKSPAGITLSLEGMSIQLGEAFPGGYGSDVGDGQVPHRYGQTDQFSHDPDYAQETLDVCSTPDQVVQKLLDQYVVPQTLIQYALENIESASTGAQIFSLKLRGEESVKSVIKEMAVRANDASWGVDAEGLFFFLQPRSTELMVLREGCNLSSLCEKRDLSQIYNRVVLTGDYVYDRREDSSDIARRSYRWRGQYVEQISRANYGERRIRLWIPWIRTQADGFAFIEQFFKLYAHGRNRYLLETTPQSNLPRPWLGMIRLENQAGQELITTHAETIRVHFDQAVYFELELGLEDPQNLWPEPAFDDRYELPDGQPLDFGGGGIGGGGGGGGGGGSESDHESADLPLEESSLPESDDASDEMSEETSLDESEDISDGSSFDDSDVLSDASDDVSNAESVSDDPSDEMSDDHSGELSSDASDISLESTASDESSHTYHSPETSSDDDLSETNEAASIGSFYPNSSDLS
jgi:hypothetical protein